MKDKKPILVLGLGKTGVSVVKYLLKKQESFCIFDQHKSPSGLIEIQRLVKKEDIFLQEFEIETLSKYSQIIVSPGIKPNNEVILKSLKLKIPVITDFDIFFSETSSMIILITGTNGKSTVVSMLERVLKDTYDKLLISSGGNIGKPVLELLQDDPVISVLEISSFQLQLTKKIQSDISLLLNLKEDHLDWHKNLDEYHKAKKRVFENSDVMLSSDNILEENSSIIKFSTFLDKYSNFITARIDKVRTEHDKLNIMAVLTALIYIAKLRSGISIDDEVKIHSILSSAIKSLNNFSSLPHRFERLGVINEVLYIDDSKATNTDSAIKAIESVSILYPDKEVILICGGESKGQTFTDLAEVCIGKIKEVFLIGKDSNILYKYLSPKIKTLIVPDLRDAILKAKLSSNPGSIILFSPACSSLDMYKDYEQRGNEFKRFSGFN